MPYIQGVCRVFARKTLEIFFMGEENKERLASGDGLRSAESVVGISNPQKLYYLNIFGVDC